MSKEKNNFFFLSIYAQWNQWELIKMPSNKIDVSKFNIKKCIIYQLTLSKMCYWTEKQQFFMHTKISPTIIFMNMNYVNFHSMTFMNNCARSEKKWIFIAEKLLKLFQSFAFCCAKIYWMTCHKNSFVLTFN